MDLWQQVVGSRAPRRAQEPVALPPVRDPDPDADVDADATDPDPDPDTAPAPTQEVVVVRQWTPLSFFTVRLSPRAGPGV